MTKKTTDEKVVTDGAEKMDAGNEGEMGKGNETSSENAESSKKGVLVEANEVDSFDGDREVNTKAKEAQEIDHYNRYPEAQKKHIKVWSSKEKGVLRGKTPTGYVPPSV